MLGYLYASTLRDMLRPRRSWPWLFLVVALTASAYAWLKFGTSASPTEGYATFSSILLMRILALVAAVTSSAVVSFEVENRTIVYLLTRPIPRYQLLLGRTFAAATSSFVIALLMALGSSAAFFGGRPFANSLLWPDVQALALGALAYCALFVLLSLLINRSMIVCLIYAFGFEPSVGAMPGQLYFLSIYAFIHRIADHPLPADEFGPIRALTSQPATLELTSATAWPAIILITAGLLAVGAWWFSRFEFLPREDAG